jgi:hypothetical protein
VVRVAKIFRFVLNAFWFVQFHISLHTHNSLVFCFCHILDIITSSIVLRLLVGCSCCFICCYCNCDLHNSCCSGNTCQSGSTPCESSGTTTFVLPDNDCPTDAPGTVVNVTTSLVVVVVGVVVDTHQKYF